MLRLSSKNDFICILVVQENRYCSVPASTEVQHITSSLQSTSGCGSKSQPWVVEVFAGQKVNISLLDFTAVASSESKITKRDAFVGPNRRCKRPYGYIVDKSAKKNVTICGDSNSRESQIIVTSSNIAEVVLINDPDKNLESRFILRFEGWSSCLNVCPCQGTHIFCCHPALFLRLHVFRGRWAIQFQNTRATLYGYSLSTGDTVLGLQKAI